MSEIAVGTLYDLNKGLMAQEAKVLDVKKEIKKKDKELFKFFSDNKFSMLLCNELKDYTVFAMISDRGREEQVTAAKEDLEICLSNRGELLSFELTKEKDAFEVWLRIEDKIHVYYLFPYTEAVLVF